MNLGLEHGVNRLAPYSDVKIAAEYGKLKCKIVEEHPQGRGKYTELKSGFISTVLENRR